MFAPAAPAAVGPSRTPAIPFLWRPQSVNAAAAITPTWDGAEIYGNHGTSVRVREGTHGGHYYQWRLTDLANVRGDFELSALWNHLEDFPRTLTPFGIRRLDATTIEVPDAAELNGILRAMGRPPLFWTRPDLQRVTEVEYLDGLARGCAPYAARGMEHFHDLGTHTALLFFPPRCLQILAAKVQTWRAIRDDTRLSNAIHCRATTYLNMLIDRWEVANALILEEAVEEFWWEEPDVTMDSISAWLDTMNRERRGKTWDSLGSFEYLFGQAVPDKKYAQTYWGIDMPRDAACWPLLQEYLRGLHAACATPKECHALLAETIYNALDGR